MEHLGFPLGPDFPDRPRFVHVTVHDVAAEPPGKGQGTLQVDPGPRPGGGQGRLREGLPGDVRGELTLRFPRDRQANPRYGNGFPEGDLPRRQPGGHRDRTPRAEGGKGYHRPDVLDDPREHGATSRPAARRPTGCLSPPAERPRRTAAPPIGGPRTPIPKRPAPPPPAGGERPAGRTGRRRLPRRATPPSSPLPPPAGRSRLRH